MTDSYKGKCPECGDETTLWLVREDVVLCDSCAEANDWLQCDVCGDWFQWDVVQFTDLEDGRQVCEYCMEDLGNDL